MAKEKEKDDDEKGSKEPELVIVTDDEKNLDVAPTGPETDDTDLPRKQKKEKPKDEDQDDEDDQDEEDSRLGASEEMEREAEAKEKDKATHKSRRQRQKEAERRLRTERNFLEKRNEDLEKEVMGLKRRMDGNDKSTLEGRIQYAKAQIAKAEKIAADAVTAGKGDEAIEANRIRDNLRDSLKGMEERKEALDKDPPPERVPEQPPEVRRNVRDWMGRTKWFDPQLRDKDSRIVRVLDISVEEDGFTPDTPEYFEELDKRIAETLPHRARKGKKKADADDEDIEDEDEDEEETPRKKAKSNGKRRIGGPAFRTGGPGRELKSNEVYLSPARIAAMKEAGAWDDPVLRQKYMKKYREWDVEHAHELDR